LQIAEFKKKGNFKIAEFKKEVICEWLKFIEKREREGWFADS
jgi:hypothetical protein